ncbi:hypothetical protein BA6E_121248 [Bacteroidales bacterium 6E]|nr:hypothetical protein BA6E_121248 [Bacteroidales bacterium 6E]
MDDVIVIILTLVLTIVAAINQNKKKKSPHSEQKTPDFWETILGQESPLPRPVEVEEIKPPVEKKRKGTSVPVSNPLRNQITRRMSPTLINDELSIAEGGRHNDIVSLLNSQKEKEEALGNLQEASGIMEDFSLKKAVIYSEIIHPKYF